TIETGQANPPVWDLPRDRPCTLGRNHNNTVVLQDEHASRWHAEIVYQDHHWYLRDLGTLNGTKLEGERIEQQAVLSHGQVIGIGNTRLRFSLDADGKEGPMATVAVPSREIDAPPPAT